MSRKKICSRSALSSSMITPRDVYFPDGGFATTGKETGIASGGAYPNASGGNRVDAEET
jgi:hypothetical protein